MKIVNKFVNVVTLGNFNPAILTPNFLKNICKIDLGSPSNAQTTPFQSIIAFGNISFIASIDRFEILEKQLEDFSKTKIFEYLDVYLTKLEHTPIDACGVNFNMDVEDLNIEIINNYCINEKSKLLSLLKAQELVVGNLIRFKSESEQENVSYDIGFFIDPQDIIGRITIKKVNPNTFNLNYNYEARNLSSKRQNILNILKKFPERLKELNNFTKEILR